MLEQAAIITSIFVAIVANYASDAGRAVVIDPVLKYIRDLKSKDNLTEDAIESVIEDPNDETKRKILDNILKKHIQSDPNLARKINKFNLEFQNHLEEKLETASKLGNCRDKCKIMIELGDIYLEKGDYSRSLTMYTNAKETCSKLYELRQAWQWEAQAIINIGKLYEIQSDINSDEEGKIFMYKSALEMYDKAQKICCELNDRDGEAQMFNNKGNIYSKIYKFNDAIHMYESARRIYHDIKDYRESEVLMNMGICLGEQGEWDSSLKKYNEGFDLIQQLDNIDKNSVYINYVESMIMLNMVFTYSKLGKSAEALEKCERCLPFIREISNKNQLSIVLCNIGNLYCQLAIDNNPEYWDKALLTYRECLDISRDIRNRRLESKILFNLGYVYINKQRWQNAINNFELSKEIFFGLGDAYRIGQALMNIGIAYSKLEGQEENAICCLKSALEFLPSDSIECHRIKEWLKEIGVY
jgi:tetratricopeptide (TPR) repeat protein